MWKNDGSAVGNVLYFQFPNCMNIKDSYNLENYSETYVHLDDLDQDVIESIILFRLDRKC